ncbi:unnamed protein product [Caenorhabditis brenneri]
MAETPETSIYENAFAKSDVTDAILVVEEKKLHVNKALLSCHFDYFKTLFNSDSKEKSMEEIPIEDVNFADFATVLSLIHLNRIELTARFGCCDRGRENLAAAGTKRKSIAFFKTVFIAFFTYFADGQRYKSYSIQELVMSCNFNNAALAQFGEMVNAMLERSIENEKANHKKPQ